MNIPRNAPRYNGKPINPAISDDLNAAIAELGADLAGKWKRKVLQCWHSGTPASHGTHDNGYAIDWSAAGMSRDEITALVHALNRHRFAAALRPVGYDLGGGNVVTTPHIHAAHEGRDAKGVELSNYSAVHHAIQPGGAADLAKMLAWHSPSHK
jgi:hypothetical protein